MRLPRRRTIAIAGAVLLALAALWAGASWHRHEQRKRFEKQWALVKIGMTEDEVQALLGEPVRASGDYCTTGERGADYYYWETKHYHLQRWRSFPYVAIVVRRYYDGLIRLDNTRFLRLGKDQADDELLVTTKSELREEAYTLDLP